MNLDRFPIPWEYNAEQVVLHERFRSLLVEDDADLRAFLREHLEPDYAVLDGESHAPSFNVEGMASRLGVSRTHLHRRVTQAFGLAPAELLIRFRLERAARMLVQRAGNVGQVGPVSSQVTAAVPARMATTRTINAYPSIGVGSYSSSSVRAACGK